MLVGCGRAEGDEVAAEGLARYDEGGDRREGEESRWQRGIVLVTRLHDGVLGDLVDDFRTLTRWEYKQLLHSTKEESSYRPECRTCCRRLPLWRTWRKLRIIRPCQSHSTHCILCTYTSHLGSESMVLDLSAGNVGPPRRLKSRTSDCSRLNASLVLE